jgi:hypothetical protein
MIPAHTEAIPKRGVSEKPTTWGPLLYFLWFFIPFSVFALVAGLSTLPTLWLAVGLGVGTILASLCSRKLDKKKLMPEISREAQGLLAKKDLLEKLTQYIEGKVKRYWLLFGVNGGAFVLAKFLHEKTGAFAGQLTGREVAVGAILFTLVMTIDIWLWGWQMRRPEFAGKHAFTLPGRAIVLLIGGLVMSAWILAVLRQRLNASTAPTRGIRTIFLSIPFPTFWPLAIIAVAVLILIVWGVRWLLRRRRNRLREVSQSLT